MKYSCQRFRRKNNTRHRGREKIKTKLNLMKLKAQTEIWEDKTIPYKKDKEGGQELIAEIRELCPTETQQFLSTIWERECVRVKFYSDLKRSISRSLSSVEGCYVECVSQRTVWHLTLHKINPGQDSYFGRMISRTNNVEANSGLD